MKPVGMKRRNPAERKSAGLQATSSLKLIINIAHTTIVSKMEFSCSVPCLICLGR